jgi:hypothetical protein
MFFGAHLQLVQRTELPVVQDRFGSRAAVAGRLVAQPVYPQ